jgi:pyruvate dehydrogenase E1 component alpha subunit
MSRAEWLNLYQQMILIRYLEERAAQLYQEGKIGGFLHLYIGQEAVGTGIVSARQPQDRVITAYRDHGIAINCGIEAKVVMAELLGKASGCSGGKGGSMHLADVTKNFWGGHAVVGAHLPIAAGLALGDVYLKNAGITICFFGEGATNIGFFHEALNLSKVWKLPVLWVCENNQYGMGTSVARASAVSEISQKASGFGMRSARVDGMNLLAVREAAELAIGEVRSGKGPYLLEAVTYRYRGHSMGDPERYRKSEEVKQWQELDPIVSFRAHLTGKKIAAAKDLEAVEAAAHREVEEAVAFAEASPEPPLEALLENIYADN